MTGHECLRFNKEKEAGLKHETEEIFAKFLEMNSSVRWSEEKIPLYQYCLKSYKEYYDLELTKAEAFVLNKVIEVVAERYSKNRSEAKFADSLFDMCSEVDYLFFEKAFGLDVVDFEQKITMKKFMHLSEEQQKEMRKRFGQICKQRRQEREMM